MIAGRLILVGPQVARQQSGRQRRGRDSEQRYIEMTEAGFHERWACTNSDLEEPFAALDHATQQSVFQHELMPERCGRMRPNKDVHERGT